MRLSWRIILLVLFTTTFIGLGNYLLTQYQIKSLHNDSEKMFAKTIFQTLRVTLVQDVIDSNKLRVTDVLKKLQSHNNPIEYLYISNGGPRHIFAHSFIKGFPRYLLAGSEGHLEKHLSQSDIELTKKIQTDRGLIYVYAEPLLPGLEAILHIGINQTEIRGQLAKNRQIILMSSTAIILLVLLIAFLWSKRITEPLLNFSQQLELFAKGQATEFNRITTTPEIQQLASTFQKVTEDRQQALKTLQESEQRFNQLAENIHETFWLGAPDWNEILYISPAYEIIWGQKAEDLYRNPRLWIETVYPDDREQVINDIPKDINSIGECIEFKKYRIQRPDGQILWIKARAYPIRDHDGQVIRIAGVAEDITEQVNMEETLRRTQKMDALGKLTGGIAHDYNNMLSIILGYTELLKGQIKDQPKLIKYIDTIHNAGERGTTLTRKLLAFSRKNTSDADTLNINTLLQDKQHMLDKTLTARINLTLDLEDKLWPVWLDSGDLEDAIVNLSINAMHAIDGNGQLTIQTRNISIDDADARIFQVSPGDYVQLSVIDTGRGMNEATKEKIFEPFFSTKGNEGTGLGLSQVYGFVQRSAGAIKLYSEPDLGTRMMLYFPRYHETKNNEKLKVKNSESDFRGHENILVVDDEQALLELTRDILESQGYQVICAKNAKQALDTLKQQSIDLVLSDIIMPEMDGYQLAAKVQEKYPEIKIQLVSGFSDDRHINMVNDELYDNLIYKPYQSHTLLKRIRDLLDGI